MENGDSLYARIAELEKENDILRERLYDTWEMGCKGWSERDLVKELLYCGEKKRVMEVWSDVYEDMSEFDEDEEEDEDSEDDEDEVREDE